MLQAGHARLAVALTAALVLHAALLLVLPSSSRLAGLQTPQRGMSVELIDSPHSRLAKPDPENTGRQPARPAMPVPHLDEQAAPTPSSVVLQAPATRPVSESVETAVRQGVESRVAYLPSRKAEDRAEAVEDAHANRDEGSATHAGAEPVPQVVQSNILAHVQYPLKARRRGWQGRAEFQFNVRQQGIYAVTLLSSTGFPLLDRAAEDGIAAVRKLSLSNGLYRMPVVFILQ